jgi:hypothetical protein
MIGLLQGLVSRGGRLHPQFAVPRAHRPNSRFLKNKRSKVVEFHKPPEMQQITLKSAAF